MFPYMTGNQINYALKHLEELGLIITGCFNDNKYDHTKWYALTEKAYSILENSQINLEKNQIDNEIENEKDKKALVVVRDDQFSLAIGKNGQNVRLAAYAIDWKIDIKSESQAAEEAEA